MILRSPGLRRGAAALAASTVLCATAAPLASAAPAAAAATAAEGTDKGLYGKGDPKYDGVWRQSLALLAQDTAGVTPAGRAVDWLVSQQCDDGSFAAYRPEPGTPCGKKTVADTNATAAAVQALAALGGHRETVGRSVDWLASVQNDDGGWGYNPGSPSDANSVSVVLGALTATGEDPAKTLSGKGKHSPYDALLSFRLGCDAKAGERGAFAYQPDKKGTLAPNADATAAAVLAGYGEGLVAGPLEKGAGEAPQPPSCDGSESGSGEARPADAAEGGAAYLAATLQDNDGHLMSALPGAEDQPDWSNTADAVVALSAGGHGKDARAALGWLEQHLGDWDKAKADPGALAQLVLAAHAAGADPRDLGGTDLVRRLNATGPKPEENAPAGGPAAEEKTEGDGGDGSTLQTVSIVGAFLVAGVGIGFLVNGRRKRR